MAGVTNLDPVPSDALGPGSATVPASAVSRLRRSLLWEVGARYWAVNGPTWAAAVALRILLAILPLLILCLIVVGFILAPQDDQQTHAQLVRVTPAPIRSSVLAEVSALNSGAIGAVSVVILLWTGSGLFGCLESCLAAAYGIPGRSLWRQKLLAVSMVAALGLTVALLVTLAAVTAPPVSSAVTPRLALAAARRAHAPWAVLATLAAVMGAFALLYHILPDRHLRWRDTLPGSAAALVGVALLIGLYPVYEHYANENGPASRAVLLLIVAVVTFVYLLAEILVLGGVLNAVIHRRRTRVPGPA